MSDDITTHVAVGPDGELIEVHDPGSTGVQIDKMYAILSVDETGEGIVGLKTAHGLMPLVASELRVIEKMKGPAQRMATAANRKMALVEFSTRTVIETIEP